MKETQKATTELKDLALENLANLEERKSLGQHVFDNLKKAIIKGDIAPGSRLIEIRLAQTLGISRTPVREAIHKLEREGYIRKLPRGGFHVLGLDRDDVQETWGIRTVLESYAARLATIKHQKKDLIKLEEKIGLYQRHLDKKNLEKLPQVNTEFHDLLYALSGSPRLIKMINDLRDQIHRFRQMILKNEKMAHMSNEDHKRMLKYIGRRDAEGVEKLVREHLIRGQEFVLDKLSNEDFQ